jgi:cell division protein FtsZ
MGEDAEMADCFRAADDVLHNACAGIAEIINVPGLVNVDFEDVKTVMSEHGKAMMGTATASGLDRARIAAEQAVASPLLEGVDLSGARGVLVNITASASLKMKERSDEHDPRLRCRRCDGYFRHGCDEAMVSALRVTVVATGLGRAASKKQSTPFSVVRTGTDNAPVMVAPTRRERAAPATATSTHPRCGATTASRHRLVSALDDSGSDRYDIPAFLRKRADWH